MAGDSLMPEEASTALRSRLQEGDIGDPFAFLQQLCAVLALEGEETARELAIRALETRGTFIAHEGLMSALLCRLGLFPYAEPNALGISSLVEYEAHRPLEFPDSNIVFHTMQGLAYRELMEGRSVVLSAPTSFGKSLILDALLAADRFDNVAVVVPTLALIDETRRRLSRFAGRYKIVTHQSQSFAERNVIVMTQERLLEVERPPTLDLFVIDEFYKLQPSVEDQDRSALLNQALYMLLKTGAPHYLAGPNIDRLAEAVQGRLGRFLRTDYSTVVTDVTEMPVAEADLEPKFRQLAATLTEPTLVFCRSVPRVRAVGAWLLEDRTGRSGGSGELAEWLAGHYHPDWLVSRALRAGVGLHHARLPRSIGQEIVRAFNDGELDILICTSTLIEGVNTRAKNVVILDNQIGTKRYDHFTWNNIRGRAGRMGRHFVGRVFSLRPRPTQRLPEVDVPAVSQSDDSPLSLLLQMGGADLTDASLQRLQPVLQQQTLSIDVLRANRGVEPQGQIGLAEALLADPRRARTLSWSRYPTYDELVATVALALEHIPPYGWQSHAARSARQLALFVTDLSRADGDAVFLIDRLLSDRSPDEAVEDALDFVRFWPGHHLPRLLRTVGAIAAEVLPRMGVMPGSYDVYAAAAERLFLPPYLAALEDYGLPVQISLKLGRTLRGLRSVDEALDAVRALPVRPAGLSPFELDLLNRTRASL